MIGIKQFVCEGNSQKFCGGVGASNVISSSPVHPSNALAPIYSIVDGISILSMLFSY